MLSLQIPANTFQSIISGTNKVNLLIYTLQIFSRDNHYETFRRSPLIRAAQVKDFHSLRTAIYHLGTLISQNMN